MKLSESLAGSVVVLQRAENVGIYFLLRGGHVVYIGQSKNLLFRIGAHIAEAGKDFDAYAVLPCEPSELDKLEIENIVRYAPEYNRTLPTTSGHISITKIRELSGVRILHIRKALRAAGIRPSLELNNALYSVEQVRPLFQTWGGK
jgi:hypothetical protein